MKNNIYYLLTFSSSFKHQGKLCHFHFHRNFSSFFRHFVLSRRCFPTFSNDKYISFILFNRLFGNIKFLFNISWKEWCWEQ